MPIDEGPPPGAASKGRRGRNLPVAIATGVTLGALVLLTVTTSRLAFLALVAVVVIVAQHEFYSVLRGRGFAPAAPLGFAASVVIMGGAHSRGPEALTFGLVLAALAALLWYLVDPERERVLANAGTTLFGVVYIPFLAAHVILLRRLPDGASLVILVILCTVVADVAAFAVGTMTGRTRMAPSVSPGKTWEGTIGAGIFVVATAFVAGALLTDLGAGVRLAIGLGIAIAAPLGDLCESLLKRDLEVKDFGTIFPGHGGALDRIDALLFAVPASFWFLVWAL